MGARRLSRIHSIAVRLGLELPADWMMGQSWEAQRKWRACTIPEE